MLLISRDWGSASAYIKSQAHAVWTLIRSRYDDGGYSGGSTDRPDLQKLLDDIRARKIAPTQSPFRFEAAILSRMRSEVTSRSN